MIILLIIYGVLLFIVAAYTVINIFNLMRFRLENLRGDRSKVLAVFFVVLVVMIIGISLVGGIISYNL